MQDPAYNVLFLCTGNSARSLLAEAILNDLGQGRFHAYSAGSMPKDAPHPLTLDLLSRRGHDLSAIWSKSWDEFARHDAPQMDFVFTVCDNAANEVCPVWPGHPVTAHWGLPDPAAVTGSDSERALAFQQTYGALANRLAAFVALPIASLDRMALRDRLQSIGNRADARSDA
ncbi:arsenate reductase ArsC [Paracoccus sp. TK19116]|uniref:Arsenate reductase ArsC n=1 Tax=Paracoccus albicereus TaxID=2922394 RepID=A0ABT1MNW4_9RHOB|nr:arsenate reductase ArsC [Paracoccus albicereus]MCQ0969983.1 arsenate reductase ArsC [Paracoccus albicereus]